MTFGGEIGRERVKWVSYMSNFNLKPSYAPVKKYYATLEQFACGHFDNEGNIRGAFEDLLKTCARPFEWTVVPEYRIARKEVDR